ncbi:hypothetical protein ACFP81_01740 [Deinococcus lacus]|uniref:DUF7660 domain-containing protein n=1 Tax=Deinococcus lacus TaxID=392561 RepID=A0ABW1Y995_9DEIO
MQTEQVKAREDLAEFVHQLCHQLQQSPDSWEHRTLPEYLEAMASWTKDMDGWYLNRGETVPEQPTWTTLAQILSAATMYE